MTEILLPDGSVSQPPGHEMNVKPSDLDDVICEKCKNFTFIQVSMMKRIPALISPTGKEAFVPMTVYACNSCGNVNDRFIQGMGGWFKGSTDERQQQSTKVEGSQLPGLEPVTPPLVDSKDD